jgi:hypothetical protein
MVRKATRSRNTYRIGCAAGGEIPCRAESHAFSDIGDDIVPALKGVNFDVTMVSWI